MSAYFKSPRGNVVWFGGMEKPHTMEIEVEVEGHPPLRAIVDNAGDADYDAGNLGNAFLHLLGIPATPGGAATGGQFVSTLPTLEEPPGWIDDPPEEAKVRILTPQSELRERNYSWERAGHDDVEVVVRTVRLLRLTDHPALAAVYYPGREAPPDKYLLYIWDRPQS